VAIAEAYDPGVKSSMSRSIALALLAAAGAGCASARRSARTPESAAALAIPERDPADQGTPRQRPLVTGVEQATTAASLDAKRLPILVRILAPELTPAGAEDVRLAFEECPWAPPPERTSLAERIATVRVRTPGEPAR